MTKFVFALFGICFAGTAVAQNAPRPDPGDPKLPARPITYRSAFEDYRPYAEQELVPWRKANEEVGAGHAGHKAVQGAGQASPAKPPAAPAGAKPPVGEGRGDHK